LRRVLREIETLKGIGTPVWYLANRPDADYPTAYPLSLRKRARVRGERHLNEANPSDPVMQADPVSEAMLSCRGPGFGSITQLCADVLLMNGSC
jgi:hypothetical protein